ncbi:MAG: hypothetical protein AB7F96_13130 [Beijerinckiaceae bacterium]
MFARFFVPIQPALMYVLPFDPSAGGAWRQICERGDWRLYRWKGRTLARKESAAEDTQNGAERNNANGSGHDVTPVIDQVRELLFGDANRTIDTRLEALMAKVDRQHAEIMDRFAQIEARMVVLEKDVEDRRLASIEQIGEAIAQLGASVRNMSTAKKG